MSRTGKAPYKTFWTVHNVTGLVCLLTRSLARSCIPDIPFSCVVAPKSWKPREVNIELIVTLAVLWTFPRLRWTFLATRNISKIWTPFASQKQWAQQTCCLDKHGEHIELCTISLQFFVISWHRDTVTSWYRDNGRYFPVNQPRFSSARWQSYFFQ